MAQVGQRRDWGCCRCSSRSTSWTQTGVAGSEVYIATFYRQQQAVIRALIAGLDVFTGVSVVISASGEV